MNSEERIDDLLEEPDLPDVCEAFALSELGQFIQDHNFNSEPLNYYFENSLC